MSSRSEFTINHLCCWLSVAAEVRFRNRNNIVITFYCYFIFLSCYYRIIFLVRENDKYIFIHNVMKWF